MNTTNPPTASPFELVHDTVVGRIYGHFVHHESSTATRLLLIVFLALLAHVLVKITRHLSEWFIKKSQAQKNPLDFVTQQPKFVTLTRLIVSGITFVIYFFAVGLVLQEFGVDLTAYLASATVIGRVEEIGLRFTKLLNFYNQEIFIPNRTIANVSRFPHGGVHAYADIQMPDGADHRSKAVQTVGNVARGMWRQFGAIILNEPALDEVETAQGSGWSFVRVHFKIWPGQGNLIETTFRQQIVHAMKTFDANYADWQVAVTYRAMTAAKK